MTKAVIAGIGTTNFGYYPDSTVRKLSVEAIDRALSNSGVPYNDVQKIFFGNAAAGIMTQQEMIRGQVTLRNHPLSGTPLINIENACASGGSAFHLAFESVRAGQCDVALVVGVEVLNHKDKERAFKALWGSTDISEIGEYPVESSETRSVLMKFYARLAREIMEKYGLTAEDYAQVSVKNRNNAALNPIAQFHKSQTIEQVLNTRMIEYPLTLPMCAPLTDGATALIVCSEAYARKLDGPLAEIKACTLAGSPDVGKSPVMPATQQAYEYAGFGPEDFDLIELHDAAAPAELLQYAEIGLCSTGDIARLIREGVTAIDGAIPVNTSGGLLSRGHALGATGCAQIAELYDQLCGRAGKRQLDSPQVGLAVNGGGWLADTYAVTVATILQKY